MDFYTVETKLKAGKYATPEEFIRDAKLIFDNCRRYYRKKIPLRMHADKMERFLWQQLKAIPEWSHLVEP